MMTTAHVQPFHPGQNIPEFFGNRFQGFLQIVRILLAKGVKVQPVQKPQGLGGHLPVPDLAGHPQTTPWGAGVVDGVPFLGGAFRVDP